jgi:hypothetical protein
MLFMEPGACRRHSKLRLPLHERWVAPFVHILARSGAAAIAILIHSTPDVRAQDLPPSDLSHMREELGVNNFTAPPIDRLLQQLAALRPFGYDKLWRPIPTETPQNRAQIALITGMVIADGFLAVAGEKPSRIEPSARALLRLTKGLGVSDRVLRHGQSVIQLASDERWPEVKRELVRSQAEVEAALISLKDEEIAHLIAVGGWVRGLEIVSTEIGRAYSPERAAVLLQPELVGYFDDRIETLNPNLKKLELFKVLQRNIHELNEKYLGAAEKKLTEEDVKAVQKLATEMVDAIGGPARKARE